jgi:hypothetical protein
VSNSSSSLIGSHFCRHVLHVHPAALRVARIGRTPDTEKPVNPEKTLTESGKHVRFLTIYRVPFKKLLSIIFCIFEIFDNLQKSVLKYDLVYFSWFRYLHVQVSTIISMFSGSLNKVERIQIKKSVANEEKILFYKTLKKITGMEGAQHNQTIDNKGSNGQIGKFKSP